ncbi:ergothioneine biosynthesis glutamate--cysteine ligase EgtA [Streptomyces sp. ACA25]|uniref:ergothioneine biosynthesis glutamate--cysteine ligase EgtA n=1 Tax=Streptomyces sp. ACA25 TaxID=3022596 RepID=UPI002307E284|nr:ergothioneine biosynthesis glutamate--cysteine ligase EgtA [Streptomyces sp. ACA25]MDB1090379.1 ergothioneine biosynthesis glutamate--cysteine ligase EgtA [Streptomyces sp. ACA25]
MEPGLGEREAEAHVGGICFKTGPPQRTGVELEWLVRDRADPQAFVPARRLDAALAPLERPGGLPGGSALTREPGGQVELSTRPAASLPECVRAAATDFTCLRQALAAAGLEPAGLGLDPHRSPPRIVDHPRYRAMEAYFDRIGPWGRVMMRATAALQISLDAGDDTDGVTGYRYRWRLAHRLGPVLVAAFANSPLWRGRPTGWVSTRQALWARLDPQRTRPPEGSADPRTAWTRHALDAPLLCVRRTPPAAWTAPSGLTFRAWLCAAHSGPPPRLADLDYHLGTLFPPVRPRGWMELRMIDAQQGDQWVVPLAVTATLLDDPLAAVTAYEATEHLTRGSHFPGPDVWLRAARSGPADPELGKASRACLTAAVTALARYPASRDLARAVAGFADRYSERGRCPADDQLAVLRDGAPSTYREGTWP